MTSLLSDMRRVRPDRAFRITQPRWPAQRVYGDTRDHLKGGKEANPPNTSVVRYSRRALRPTLKPRPAGARAFVDVPFRSIHSRWRAVPGNHISLVSALFGAPGAGTDVSGDAPRPSSEG